MLERIDDSPTLPARQRDGHKGTFGSVGIVGGCAGDEPRMIGAPALAALGALRAGCGLVRVATPGPILDTVLSLAPFATGVGLEIDASGGIDASASAQRFDRVANTSDVLIIGPGMGRAQGVDALVLRAITRDQRPTVIDADAINALCGITGFWEDLHAHAILTPHPGEARRLVEALAIQTGDPAGNEQERVACCGAIAARLGAVVVLKGAGTVVSDGLRAWVCRAGHPCMGTGGTGDVLAGVLAGLLAQHLTPAALAHAGQENERWRDAFTLCCAGVDSHARAGEAWAARSHASGGMTPAELAELVPAQIERLRAQH